MSPIKGSKPPRPFFPATLGAVITRSAEKALEEAMNAEAQTVRARIEADIDKRASTGLLRATFDGVAFPLPSVPRGVGGRIRGQHLSMIVADDPYAPSISTTKSRQEREDNGRQIGPVLEEWHLFTIHLIEVE